MNPFDTFSQGGIVHIKSLAARRNDTPNMEAQRVEISLS